MESSRHMKPIMWRITTFAAWAICVCLFSWLLIYVASGVIKEGRRALQEPANFSQPCRILNFEVVTEGGVKSDINTSSQGFIQGRILLDCTRNGFKNSLQMKNSAEPTVPPDLAPGILPGDTLNGLAVVIALVTLILTLGTTWLMEKQETAQKLISELQEVLSRDARDRAARERMQVLLLEARRACLIFLETSQVGQPASKALQMHLWLEDLQSPVEKTRERAHKNLRRNGLGFGIRQEAFSTLDPVFLYCKYCEDRVPAGQSSWCDVFSIR